MIITTLGLLLLNLAYQMYYTAMEKETEKVFPVLLYKGCQRGFLHSPSLTHLIWSPAVFRPSK